MANANNIAKSLSRLTGKNYEDLIGKADSCISSVGSLDVKVFARIARNGGASDSAIAEAVSSLTGMGLESALIEINMPTLGRLDSGLRMPGLPSWHPMNKK